MCLQSFFMHVFVRACVSVVCARVVYLRSGADCRACLTTCPIPVLVQGILVNVSPRDASNWMSQGVMPDNVQGSPHRGLISHDPARGGVVGGSNSMLGGVLSDLEKSRERGWGSESAEDGGAGWENADVLMPTPPRTARLTPLPAFGLRGRGGDGGGA
jgi:hypothetical protein